MDIFIITGAQAVGKMTVGEELCKLKGYKLFHNHMTIEFFLQFFEYRESADLIRELRNMVMKRMATSDNKGMVFTYLWAFDHQEDWDYIEHVKDIFKDHNVYIVELVSDIKTRLKRNKTENRLSKKASKRDIEASNQRLINTYEKYRVVSNDGEITYDKYIKIDNTFIEPIDCAKKILEYFEL